MFSCSYNKLNERLNFYKHINKFSNDYLSAQVDPLKGIYTVANKKIVKSQKLLKVPMHFSMCPTYLFPFKFEIMNIITKIPWLTNNLGQTSSTLSIWVLTFYVMYERHADKKKVKEYIIENNITDYFNCHETHHTLKDSFPDIVNMNFHRDHYIRISKLGYFTERENQIFTVYNFVLNILKSSPHFDIIFPWLSGFEDFINSHSIVISRSLSINMDILRNIEKFNPQSKTNTKSQNINWGVNKQYFGIAGQPVFCILAFFDSHNHYEKNKSLNDRRTYRINVTEGFFSSYSNNEFEKGEEVDFTYSNMPNNLTMLNNFGFVYRNNIFNEMRIAVAPEQEFTHQQFTICKEIGCGEANHLQSPLIKPQKGERQFQLNLLKESTFLVNYSKVKMLNEPKSIDTQNILKIFLNNGSISYQHDVFTYLNYYKELKLKFGDEFDKKFLKLVYGSQQNRNLCIKIMKKKYFVEEIHLKKYEYFKIMQLIDDLELSYKDIINKHFEYSLKKVSKVTIDEIYILAAKNEEKLAKIQEKEREKEKEKEKYIDNEI